MTATAVLFFLMFVVGGAYAGRAIIDRDAQIMTLRRVTEDLAWDSMQWAVKMQRVVDIFERANKNLDPNARGAALAPALAYSQQVQRAEWEKQVMEACSTAPGIVRTSHQREKLKLWEDLLTEADATGKTPVEVAMDNLPKAFIPSLWTLE